MKLCCVFCLFEYADFKNCRNHDVTPMVPVQKLKIPNGYLMQQVVANNLTLSTPIDMVIVSIPMFLRSKNQTEHISSIYIFTLIIIN